MSGLPALAPVGGSQVPAPVAAGLPASLAVAAQRVSSASEPAFVRDGSPAVKRAYQEASGFEEMLVEQLAQSIAKTGGLGEGGGAGESGAASGEGEPEGGGASLLTSMLPQTLSEAVIRGGGLGLATRLTTEIDPAALTDSAAPAGAKESS